MISDLISSFKAHVFENEFFGGAFYLSALGYILVVARNIPKQLWDFAVKRLTFSVYFDQNDNLYEIFEKWLSANYPEKYRYVQAYTVNGRSSSVYDDYDEIPVCASGPSEKTSGRKVKFYQHEDSFWILYMGKPFFIRKGRTKAENANSISRLFLNEFYILSFGFKDTLKQLLETLVREHEENLKKEQKIEMFTSNHGWDRCGEYTFRDMDSVVMDGDIKKSIMSRVDNFISSESWFVQRGIPYKLSMCFYGPPGNGKTSSIQALANYYKRNIYYLSLSHDTDDAELIRLFTRIEGDAIMVLEDFDTVFDGRKCLIKTQVTFSGLLNCMDGMFYKYGLILIITANDISKLDPAILRRGRMDMDVEFKNPSKECIKRYSKLFYNVEIEDSKIPENIPMSKVQDAFLMHKNDHVAAYNCLSESNDNK